MSIGGWILSKEISNAMQNDTTRDILTDSIVDFVLTYQFDGVGKYHTKKIFSRFISQHQFSLNLITLF